MYILGDDWFFFTPNTQKIYYITVYDDGNQAYEQYVNEWLITGKWLGKRALVNVQNPSIKIDSISKWKLSKLQV